MSAYAAVFHHFKMPQMISNSLSRHISFFYKSIWKRQNYCNENPAQWRLFLFAGKLVFFFLFDLSEDLHFSRELKFWLLFSSLRIGVPKKNFKRFCNSSFLRRYKNKKTYQKKLFERKNARFVIFFLINNAALSDSVDVCFVLLLYNLSHKWCQVKILEFFGLSEKHFLECFQRFFLFFSAEDEGEKDRKVAAIEHLVLLLANLKTAQIHFL